LLPLLLLLLLSLCRSLTYSTRTKYGESSVGGFVVYAIEYVIGLL